MIRKMSKSKKSNGRYVLTYTPERILKAICELDRHRPGEWFGASAIATVVGCSAETVKNRIKPLIASGKVQTATVAWPSLGGWARQYRLAQVEDVDEQGDHNHET